MPRTPILVARRDRHVGLVGLGVGDGGLVSTAEASIGVSRLLRTTSARNTRGSEPGADTRTSIGNIVERTPRSPTMQEGRSCTTAPTSAIGVASLKEVDWLLMKVWTSPVTIGQVHLAHPQHRVAEGEHAVRR